MVVMKKKAKKKSKNNKKIKDWMKESLKKAKEQRPSVIE